MSIASNQSGVIIFRRFNNTMDGSIGTQPGKVIFGHMVDSDLAMYLSEGQTGRNAEDYLIKLRKAQFILIQTLPQKSSKEERWMVDRTTRK